jgi:hypothetical protein
MSVAMIVLRLAGPFGRSQQCCSPMSQSPREAVDRASSLRFATVRRVREPVLEEWAYGRRRATYVRSRVMVAAASAVLIRHFPGSIVSGSIFEVMTADSITSAALMRG